MAIVACPQCGTKNRVDDRAVNRQPVCGKCGAKLPAAAGAGGDGTPLKVTDASFARDVLESAVTTLVDCWAPWCGPCRTIGPIMDELAAESRGRYRIAKLNVDENPATAGRYRIEGIPALLFFKGGKLVDQLVGAYPKGTIVERLERQL